MLCYIFFDLTIFVALAGEKCNHKTLSKGKSNKYQCQLFELSTFVVNGEYKVFDLLCNETYDSQVFTRVIEECRNLTRFVIERMIQNYE